MDERTPGLSLVRSDDSSGDESTRENRDAAPPDEHADELAQEITNIRTHLSGLLGELNRRRKAVFDVREQISRHPVLTASVIASLLAVVAGGVALGYHRHRQQQRPAARLARLRQALSRMVAHPRRVARVENSISGRILSASASAATGIVVRELFQRLRTRPVAKPA